MEIFEVKDPNIFGETLRDVVFVKHDDLDFGCYTTFKLSNGFSKVEDSHLRGILSDIVCAGQEDHAEAYINGNILVAWFWDGDGTLFIGSKDLCGNISGAVNYDCKKKSGWEWV